MKRLWMLSVAGCAQLLGLDPTHQPVDASVDAPSVCDGLPACVAASGVKTVCGQIVGTGAQAGMPLRVAAPTGNACSGSTEGPCGIDVEVLAMADLFGGGSSSTATVDDCGRFTGMIGSDVTDIAIKLTGTDIANSASVLPGLGSGEGSAVTDAFAVTPATEMAWSSQAAAADVSTGYLVRYLDVGGNLVTGTGATINGGNPLTNPPGTEPWAAYFDDQFGSIGSGSQTGSAGTAFVQPGTGTVNIGGFRQGARCGQPGLQTVSGFVIFVLEHKC